MSDSSDYLPGKVTGSCACNRITFETTTSAGAVVFCYCRECAKVSGCGYIAFVRFSEANVKWSAKPDIWKSSSVAERGFCKECGSTMSMHYHGQEGISIARAAINSSTEPIPNVARHIFVGEKSDWVVIPDDGVERFDKFRDS